MLVDVDNETPDEVHRLSGDLVIQAARLVRAARRRVDAPAAGVRVLSLLDEHGPLGVSALASLDRCTQPSMSGTVSMLVERGWVAKEADPSDARASLVRSTAPGRKQLAAVRRSHAEAVATRFEAGHRPLTDLATAVGVLRDLLATPEPTISAPEGL